MVPLFTIIVASVMLSLKTLSYLKTVLRQFSRYLSLRLGLETWCLVNITAYLYPAILPGIDIESIRHFLSRIAHLQTAMAIVH